MRRFLVATQTGGVTSAVKYEHHQIIDADDADDAVSKYNQVSGGHYGTAIAYIPTEAVVKHVRSGPVDAKMMEYLYKREALRPVYDPRGDE